MLKEKYEVDGDVLGLSEGEAAEGKFLGRIIRCTSRGLEWEADPKQVEGLLSECGLDCGHGVETPGVKVDLESEGELMSKSEASKFRRVAAKVNYLSQDRFDLAYASKELSKKMATPRVGDEIAAKRVIR